MHSFSYIDGNQSAVSASDRGLGYGDGLFETMVAIDGRVRWLDFHLERLWLGCRRLAIPAPPEHELRDELNKRLPSDGRVVVKLLLTRGSSSRGYAPPARPTPVIIVFVGDKSGPVGSILTATSAETLDLRLSESEKLAGIKHLCRLEQVLAQLELRERRAEEGVLLSRSGWVVGGARSNLFVVKDGRVLTPAIRLAGICGVMRRVVLNQCRRLGIDAAEVDMDVAALTNADELFLTNAVIGLRSITTLDGRAVPARALTATLHGAVFEADHA